MKRHIPKRGIPSKTYEGNRPNIPPMAMMELRNRLWDGPPKFRKTEEELEMDRKMSELNYDLMRNSNAQYNAMAQFHKINPQPWSSILGF